MQRSTIIILVLAAFTTYLVVGLLTGGDSIYRLQELEAENALLRKELETMTDANRSIRTDIDRLDPSNPDYDFIEEKIKQSLGVGLPEEWIVPTKPDGE